MFDESSGVYTYIILLYILYIIGATEEYWLCLFERQVPWVPTTLKYHVSGRKYDYEM